MGSSTRLRVNAPDVINEVIEGDAVVINLATGDYYSLTGSAALAWEALLHAATVDEVIESVAARYDGDGTEIADAVTSFVADLQREHLVVNTDQPCEPHLVVAHQQRMPFVPPRFDKFTDMQDLILLDPVHEVSERGWPHAASAS